MFKDCMSTTDEINAKTPSRQDAAEMICKKSICVFATWRLCVDAAKKNKISFLIYPEICDK